MEPKITKAHHGGEVHGYQDGYDVVVIHDEEFPLRSTSAESIATYFADPNHGPSCAHYIEDSDSEQHSVPDNQIAYHAPPNARTVGIERDGFASWTLDDWHRPDAQKTTCRVAARTAELLARRNLPVRWLSVADLRAGHSGVTSHANRSRAFGQSTHRDPGPYFPVLAFMGLVRLAHEAIKDEASVKEFQRNAGLTADGDVGPVTLDHLTNWLYAGGGDQSKVDPMPAPAPVPQPRAGCPVPHPALDYNGDLREPTVEALQRALNWHLAGPDIVVSGRPDKSTIRALQHYLKVPVDGDLGPRTISALQVRVNHVLARPYRIEVDTDFGPLTVNALKRALNGGKF
jgi:hypothetical protein